MAAAEREPDLVLTREQMLLGTARQLASSDFKVYTADGVGGWPEPVPVNGHVPDIKARWNDEMVLVRVETPETLHGAESVAQWKAFGRSYCQFEVACPRSIVKEARLLARERDVRIHRFWIY